MCLDVKRYLKSYFLDGKRGGGCTLVVTQTIASSILYLHKSSNDMHHMLVFDFRSLLFSFQFLSLSKISGEKPVVYAVYLLISRETST